jgi:hypothetical protein
MNSFLQSFVCLSLAVFSKLNNAQTSVCNFETNIDYLTSSDITFVKADYSASCCILCGFQSGCVGKTDRFLIKENTFFHIFNNILFQIKKGFTYVIETKV